MVKMAMTEISYCPINPSSSEQGFILRKTHTQCQTFSPGLQVEINNVISFDINATLQQTLKYTQRTHVVCFCPLVDIFKEPHKYVGKGK